MHLHGNEMEWPPMIMISCHVTSNHRIAHIIARG